MSFCFFFHYYHQNFDINFWCSIFFKKATQFSFTFLAIMFFWSKIIFDENFDVIYFFSKNYTKVISFSAKQKVLWIQQSFNAASKTKNWSNPQQKKVWIFVSSGQVTTSKAKINLVLWFISKARLYERVGWGGVCSAPFTVLDM